MKKISVFVPAEQHKQLKHLATEKETSIQQLASDALSSIIANGPVPVSNFDRALTRRDINRILGRLETVLENSDPATIQAFLTNLKAWEYLLSLNPPASIET